LVRRALLRHSLDTISRRRGLVLTTDHIHQNSRGAALVAEVIDTWLPTRSA
ncbi:SGNH/GDSL hydrolase family protein, partial [Streptomyces sp. DH41]|nr:SGNH/GDSL hydrolase family protein [Streptomyces sp. DH41]